MKGQSRFRRFLVMIGLVFLMIAPLAAAEAPENFAALGMSWNQYAVPQLSGNLLYAKKLGESTYSFNFVDMVSTSMVPFKTATSITTGIGQRFLRIGSVSVYGTTGVGILAGGENVSYSWTSGGAVSIPIGKGFAILPNVRFIKNSVTELQWIGGVMIGWGK
jgi:hypothetical protein